MMTIQQSSRFAVVSAVALALTALSPAVIAAQPAANALVTHIQVALPPSAPAVPAPAVLTPPVPLVPPVPATAPVPPLPPDPLEFHFDIPHFALPAFDWSEFDIHVDRDAFERKLRDAEAKIADKAHLIEEAAARAAAHAMADAEQAVKATAAPIHAPTRQASPLERQAARAEDLYRQARTLIDQSRYERAIAQLDELTRMGDAPRADAALYWKAYAQAKLAQRAESLATLADLQKRFAKSAWVEAARALEVEVRQASGQSVSVDMLPDEDLKLLALRGLMQSDPDRALPMVEQVLAGNSSVRVKENALFVLSQSRAPRARDIIARSARSGSNPDVQLAAVRYLGAMRGTDNQQVLADIYRATSDEAVKRAAITALYRAQAGAPLADIARSEKDLTLKRQAVRHLGSMPANQTGEALKGLYRSDGSDIKRDVVSALAAQRNAAALVELARAEKDATLKRDLVQRLSTMRAPEAVDYMAEILK